MRRDLAHLRWRLIPTYHTAEGHLGPVLHVEAELLPHLVPVSLPQAGVADCLQHKEVDLRGGHRGGELIRCWRAHLELLDLGPDSVSDPSGSRGVGEGCAEVTRVLEHFLNLVK